jgi:hypothetical protein
VQWYWRSRGRLQISLWVAKFGGRVRLEHLAWILAEIIGKYCHLVKVHPILVSFSFPSTTYDLVYRIIFVRTEIYLIFMLSWSLKLYGVNKNVYKHAGSRRNWFVTINVLMQCAAGRIQYWTISVLSEFPNTVHSCSRHGVAAVRLTSERPGSVLPVRKTLTLLGVPS